MLMGKKIVSQDDVLVGRRIKELREDVLDLTQQAFADRLGVTRGSVGNWELGQGIKRANLQLIARVYNVPLASLVTPDSSRDEETSLDRLVAEIPSEFADETDAEEAADIREDAKRLKRRAERLIARARHAD